MNTSFTVASSKIEALLHTRKMAWSDIESWTSAQDSEQLELDIEQLKSLADLLSVPLATLFEGHTAYPFDLDNDVKVGRKGQQYERVKKVDGVPMYHYRHVLKTSADPHLMALRTSPLCDDDAKVILNKGHLAKEFVYVLKGKVKMHWQKEGRPLRTEILNEGDSVYLEPWVRHAFSMVEEGSEILAVDYM